MAFLAAMFVMTSCGEGNTPKGVAGKIVKALQDNDYDKFVDFICIDTKDFSDVENAKKMFSAVFKEALGKVLEKKGGIKSFEIISEEIDEKGENAVVKMNLEFGDGSVEKDQDMKLKKDKNGDWKVTVDK